MIRIHALLKGLSVGLVLLLAVACEKAPPGYNPPRNAEQTLLLYMPGTDLSSFYDDNIENICKAVTRQVPGRGRMLVCRQSSHRTAQIEEIYYDRNAGKCRQKLLKSYETFEAGDAESVSRLLTDAGTLAPAERYGLIIGCHGKAWIPAEEGAITNRSGRRPEASIWTPVPGALPTRSFGDLQHELDIPELVAALEAQPYRFDYLIFDACFMANIETLYELRNAVDYIVASPCEIMAAGFPYDRALPHLFSEGGGSYDLGQVCHEFWNFYQNDWQNVPSSAQSGCISLAVTAELGALAAAVRAIEEAGPVALDPEALSGLQVYEGLRTHLFYDLGHFVSGRCGDPVLLDRFETQLDRAFPPASRLHTPKFYSVYGGKEDDNEDEEDNEEVKNMTPVEHYSGVSVSEPSTLYVDDNRQTAWYRATHGS